MKKLLIAVAVAALVAGCIGKKPGNGGVPKPPEKPAVETVKGTHAERLARTTPDGRLTILDGTRLELFMAVQCCMGFETRLEQRDGKTVIVLGGTPQNSRWPLADKGWMDYTAQFGANAFHMRLGPFFGDPTAESEWTDLGGPYNTDGTFNEAFWSKVEELVEYAASNGWYVEINLIDTWYCKRASSDWGDQRMPWPQQDIDSCGREMTPTQEAFARFAVSQLNDYWNVIWLVDNELDQIRRAKLEWATGMYRIIRDEEQKTATRWTHIVGTTHAEFCEQGPFEYCVTHARAPVQKIAGRFTLNGERNPAFPPEQEAQYFAEARENGDAWAFWRAEMTNEEAERTLQLFGAITKGNVEVECFAPDSEDPAWVGVAADGCARETVAALRSAQGAVGDRRVLFPSCAPGDQACITTLQFPAAFQTLDLIAANIRGQGLCASRSRDKLFVKTKGVKRWDELAGVALTDGGYPGQPCKRNFWEYRP